MSRLRVLIFILLVVLIIFGVELLIGKPSSPYLQSTALSPNSSQIAQGGWSTCVDTYGDYSFRYPSSWHVLKPSEGAPIETNCEGAGANFSINPIDPNYAMRSNADYTAGSIEFSFIKGTELKAIPQSLDDFFAQRPAILQSNKVVMTGTVAGEKATWLKEPANGFIDIYFWHNGNIMNITADKISDTGLLNVILDSFNFD